MRRLKAKTVFAELTARRFAGGPMKRSSGFVKEVVVWERKACAVESVGDEIGEIGRRLRRSERRG